MNKKILEQIKYCRKQRNISIRELSNKCNISYSYLLQLEKGIKDNPTLNVLESIANVLDLEITFYIK
ncbi:MAG: helix-turn-helix domain-containing protein [Clostridia bacterium]